MEVTIVNLMGTLLKTFLAIPPPPKGLGGNIIIGVHVDPVGVIVGCALNCWIDFYQNCTDNDLGQFIGMIRFG